MGNANENFAKIIIPFKNKSNHILPREQKRGEREKRRKAKIFNLIKKKS